MAEGTHPYVKLARAAIEDYVRGGKLLQISLALGPDLIQRAGVFVSIKKRGMLRGCIGTVSPTKSNLAEEIVYNAISAATMDPRFPEVTLDELEELEISVDVLSPAEEVADWGDLDPKRYGVVVSSGGRRGLLLPDLEGVDAVEQQLGIALKKAGIDRDEKFKVERFEVKRYR